MDTFYFLGQLLCLGVLALGAWLCLIHAGKYDEERLHPDVSPSDIVPLQPGTEATPTPAANDPEHGPPFKSAA